MKDPPLLLGAVVLAFMFAAQWAVGRLRRSFPALMHQMDNTPIMLMDGEEVLHDNMKKANISEDELSAKLRQANVRSLSQIDVVVMETTGDISVMANITQPADLDPFVLKGVRK
jgi:uncharacterized membrane protein YcaP (DUF421 family)